MKTATVSAIVTTYKRPELVKRAIRSVISQTLAPDEIIVVEDGPETDLQQWCSELADIQVKYVSLGDNRGLSAARNTGASVAMGRWLAYLDDDDEWMPNRLKCQLEALSQLDQGKLRSTGVIYCGSMDPAFGKRPEKRKLPLEGGLIKDVIERRGIHTLSSTFLFNASALKVVNGFDETLSSSVDHDIWMALANSGYSVLTVPDILVVTHGDPERRMVFDGERRISGVRAFLDKWEPVFVEWWGPTRAFQFINRYFARVSAFVIAQALVEGKVAQALKLAVSVVVQSREDRGYAISAISRRSAGAILEKFTGYNRPESIFRRRQCH